MQRRGRTDVEKGLQISMNSKAKFSQCAELKREETALRDKGGAHPDDSEDGEDDEDENGLISAKRLASTLATDRLVAAHRR